MPIVTKIPPMTTTLSGTASIRSSSPERVKSDQDRHRAECRQEGSGEPLRSLRGAISGRIGREPVGRELDHEGGHQEDRELLPVIGRRPVPEVHDLGDRVRRNYDQDVEEDEKQDRSDVRRRYGDPGAATGLYGGVVRRNLRPIPVCSSNHAPLPPRLDEAPDPEVPSSMIRQTLSGGIPGCLCGSPNRHGTGQSRLAQSSGLTIRGRFLDVSPLPRAV